jgi:hypothetical protein
MGETLHVRSGRALSDSSIAVPNGEMPVHDLDLPGLP